MDTKDTTVMLASTKELVVGLLAAGFILGSYATWRVTSAIQNRNDKKANA